MLRRKNKELLENVKGPAKEVWNKLPEGSLEKIADRIESPRIYKHHKIPSFKMEKHASEELVNASSRKKVKSTIVTKDDLIEGRDRTNNILETKSSAGLNNKGWITEEKTREEGRGQNKAENKHSRDSDNKHSYAVKDTSKSERKINKKNHNEEEENHNEHYTERKHGKDRHDGGKIKRLMSNDFEEVPEKKHHRDSDKHIHAEGREKYGREINKEPRAKYEREIKRKYRNDDETQDRNAMRKQDIAKHHNPHIYERKNRQEKVKPHYEEPTMKRRRSRSREREDRRRSPSFSPRAHRKTYQDGERKNLSMLSLSDSSRKKHSDDKTRVSTNDSSSHHRRYRHSSPASGLGGYSPRKRKSEIDKKTPSPSKHSPEKKRPGWDLPPVGTDPTLAPVSSGFELSNHSVLSSMHDLAAATSLNPSIVKPLPVSFFNAVSTGKNANIDSVQLTQATRPMRRVYLENLPASASEKVVMDCFNNLLLSSGVNHIQQTRPCISCIVHKDRGQALVEFLTAEDASAALSFDGSKLFGSTVKIKRPKDYVEFATDEPERSVEVAATISDVVVDSPYKIFIGGISNHISSEMLMEIAGVFGFLKAYHFEARVSNGSCAFVEYVDHSVTIKACAGLNGMNLGGEVLTVVQAMPDASPVENDSKPPSYGIPEHAEPLLREPTQVLEIKNVFTVESLSSLSDTVIEEILEDVRLECARFGTVKSIHVARHCKDNNLATKSEEVIKKVGSEEPTPDTHTVTNDAESSFSEEATYSNSKGTGGMESHGDKVLEEDKDNDGTSVNVDKNAEVFDNTTCQEHLVSDSTVIDAGNEDLPSSTIQGCPDQGNTPNDDPELHDSMIANDIDVEKTVIGNTDSENMVYPLQEGFSECDASLELVGNRKDIKEEDEEEDDTYNHVFEEGSVLVEYARSEACRSAAHCMHRRLFDGRLVSVQYVALSLYRERFTK
ncbi:RNA recognition motif [Medicago truncatula]|uniref:RNA recognition motif n=1 Tax=Medicago truncatula TaxID=3880 RepID=A0A072VGD1_MEDTR|nr:RNA recognition motif [Medicago truncatula]